MPSHIDPAKFAYGLIQRIYAHAREEGWMPPGSKVLDPFAGVSLGALEALRLGCAWVGCELESRFYLTGMSNIAKWMHEYRHLPGWGPWAMVVNGDSRKLLEVLGHIPTQHACAISSPPYADAGKPDARHLHFDDQRTPDGRTRREASIAQKQAHGVPDSYGSAEGNLANMAVSSPPWTNQEPSHAQSSSPSSDRLRAEPPATRGQRFLDTTYGSSPGQLAKMPAGDLAISSPPYASTDTKPHALGTGKDTRATGESAARNKGDYHYGETPGNLAHLSVSSPPYSTSTQVNNHPQDMTAGKARWAGGTDSAARVKQDYVEPSTPGNLSQMPALAVSSPPYADGCAHTGGRDPKPEHVQGGEVRHVAYGESAGQLGESATPDTFWAAAKKILEQTYQCLKAGGQPVPDGEGIDFCSCE